MTEVEDGVERVDVHLKWPHEAHDFTPWLATHLDLLGNELGLKLAFVEREARVGPYRLDILAETPGEDGDVLVAIENQFGVSDLQHLGQLLTYATGRDAHIGCGSCRSSDINSQRPCIGSMSGRGTSSVSTPCGSSS